MVGSGYKGSRTGEVHGFLQAYAHPVRELALELRRHVFETRPSVAEAVRPGWKLIGYRTEAGAYFGFVAPASGYVDLGFEYGFLMVDAGELLPRGEQVRVLRLRPGNPIPAVTRRLVSEAAGLADLGRAGRARLLMERGLLAGKIPPRQGST
ncbi:MAG: hypothetical protein H7A21_01875 [Spirochaetales bacterium]|nr:hypothetical protein [Leptospiraceae bacterium]MCP5480154.1 hypothetical protein [Spirochaetales bacterium]MCP5485506.1 hypothetical protein [Spirochaetales bacterium]